VKGRVLIAKPGLDGHDRGAHLVARLLRDAGMEVIYLGLRQAPEAIAASAVAEDVDVVGLSILTGGHLGLVRKVIARLGDAGGDDIHVVVGGVIPDDDIPVLTDMGVSAVFPSSTPLIAISRRMAELVTQDMTPDLLARRQATSAQREVFAS
jgi:methylmalonyl-CoA mutase, C-terminal domain